MLFTQSFQFLPKMHKLRFVGMLQNFSDKVNFDLLSGLLQVFLFLQKVINKVGVHREDIHVLISLSDGDILVDQLDGLCTQRAPNQTATAISRLDRFINTGKPLIVYLVGIQETIGRKSVPRTIQYTIVCSESVLLFVCRETFLRCHQTFPAFDGSVDAHEIAQALFEKGRKLLLDFFDICDDATHAVFIEIESLCHIVKDANIVND